MVVLRIEDVRGTVIAIKDEVKEAIELISMGRVEEALERLEVALGMLIGLRDDLDMYNPWLDIDDEDLRNTCMKRVCRKRCVCPS